MLAFAASIKFYPQVFNKIQKLHLALASSILLPFPRTLLLFLEYIIPSQVNTLHTNTNPNPNPLPHTPALARMNSFSFCICLSREPTTNKCRMNSRRRSSRGKCSTFYYLLYIAPRTYAQGNPRLTWAELGSSASSMVFACL